MSYKCLDEFRYMTYLKMRLKVSILITSKRKKLNVLSEREIKKCLDLQMNGFVRSKNITFYTRFISMFKTFIKFRNKHKLKGELTMKPTRLRHYER